MTQPEELNQAHAFFEQGQWEKARSAYEVFLQRQDDAFARARLGTIYRFTGSLFESLEQFRRALELAPRNMTYLAALGNLYLVTGKIAQGLELIRTAHERDPDNAELFSNYLFTAHYDPNMDRVALLRDHCHWGQMQCASVRALLPRLARINPNRRIRIGYLGADFKQHSVGYTIGPLLKAHDRNRFEVYGYASVDRVDAMARQLRNSFDKYRLVYRTDDEALAHQIRADEIDILIAVGGHSFGNRLRVLAYRPAPLQIDYGGINTVGLKQVDARLTDPRRDPPESQSYFVEELVYLPEGSTCYQPPTQVPEPVSLPALQRGGVTFAACHGAHKMPASTLALWGLVLQAVPNSRLMIKCGGGESPELQQQLIQAVSAAGASPERVSVCGLWTDRCHLEFYQDVDIALDSFPFNGGVTTLEGLWMGVPMVSLVGPQTVSRTGLTILHQLDMAALAVSSPEQYVKMAAALAADLTSLAKMRATMRQRMLVSSLGNAGRYVQILEEQLLDLWRRRCDRGDD